MTSEADAKLIQELIGMTRAAQAGFLNGDPAPYQALFADDPDVSLLSPFGGVGAVGPRDVRIGVSRASSLFEMGSSDIELKHAAVADGFAMLVLIERSTARLRGIEGDRRWHLRVTQIFRRQEDGSWRVIHRHADPLTGRRGVEETLALLPG